MKKLTAILMAAGMILLAGCGSSEKVIQGNVQNAGTNGPQSRNSVTSPDAGAEAPGNEPASEAAPKGYVLTIDGTLIAVDADASPVVAALGEPVSYFEAASCAFEGLDKIYTYNGFEIDTYPDKDKDYISSVILKDDSVMTSEGLCIGDTAEKLQQVYGNGDTSENGMLRYDKDGMKLCFILRDDEIISIEYRSSVLDK